MNLPTRAGERYRCFVLVRDHASYGGPYGQTLRPMLWTCADCGYTVSDHTDTFNGKRRQDRWALKKIVDHHECGHAPCDRCGELLPRRVDGTPRQHAHNRCGGKTPGHKIEKEFVQNMATREYQ